MMDGFDKNWRLVLEKSDLGGSRTGIDGQNALHSLSVTSMTALQHSLLQVVIDATNKPPFALTALVLYSKKEKGASERTARNERQ
jgi:hypothetical protein